MNKIEPITKTIFNIEKQKPHPVFDVVNENDSDVVKILKKKHLYLDWILDRVEISKYKDL